MTNTAPEGNTVAPCEGAQKYTEEERRNLIDTQMAEFRDREKEKNQNIAEEIKGYYARFLSGELSKEEIEKYDGDWFHAFREKDRKKSLSVLDDSGSEIRRDEIAKIHDRPMTDMGNAERLADQYARNLKFCHGYESWFVWSPSEGRWKKDDIEQVYRIAKQTIRRIKMEGAAAKNQDKGDELYKWAKCCECRSHILGMTEIAKSDPAIAVLPDVWDANDYVINLLNGSYDLKTFELKKHNIKDHISKLMPFEYGEKSQCPNWLKFLNRIFKSKSDSDKTKIISFLQRAVGYTLTGSTEEQVMFLLWGSGANGKSVFIDVIRSMLGEYGCNVDSSTFIASKSGSDAGRARGDIARLNGARMVCSSENSPDSRLDESLIKNLTGSDKVTARFLYQDDFEFYPKFKIWWAFNHQPQIYDTTNSIWRRIKLIPFEEVIPDAEQDPHLSDILKREIPGIFNWAIEGLKDYYENGLQAPEMVSQATREYREDQDILHEFICDYCELPSKEDSFGKIFETTAKDLYTAYTSWNSYNGDEKTMTSTKFGNLLKDRGLKKERTNSGVRYLGIRIKSGMIGSKR